MTAYSETEILTATRALAEGYKWIARDSNGVLWVYTAMPVKARGSWGVIHHADKGRITADQMVPIFQNIGCMDEKPVPLEEVVNPPILDDTEKRYLEMVLKPLPKVLSIVKHMRKSGDEYLMVNFCNGDDMIFPYFAYNSMYTGMENEKEYTAKELKLFMSLEKKEKG